MIYFENNPLFKLGLINIIMLVNSDYLLERERERERRRRIISPVHTYLIKTLYPKLLAKLQFWASWYTHHSRVYSTQIKFSFITKYNSP